MSNAHDLPPRRERDGETLRRRARALADAVAVALVCAVLLPATASAQDRFGLQNLRPVPAWQTGTIATHGADTLDHGTLDFQLLVNHGESPLTLINDAGGTEGRIVGGITQFDLLIAAGIGDRFELGLALPMARATAGTAIQGYRSQPLEETTVGLGDLRLVPKVRLWSNRDMTDRAPDAEEWARGIALAIIAEVALPTGDQDAYLGDGGFRADPTVALDVAFGRGHLLAFDVGYRIRPETELGPVLVANAFTAAAGADVRVVDPVHLVADVTAAIHQASNLGAEDIPVEALGGGRFFLGPVVLHAAAGAGLTTGVGGPDWRVLGGVGTAYEHDTDRDGDGIANRRDACTRDAEDLDGYRDDDGCPDEDNDGDGLADSADTCPDEPEDRDGFEDDDGCPDGDRDGDGVDDALDACPDEPEDRDGFEDDDGCFELDNDRDGFLDGVDECPMVPGPERGCPPTILPPPHSIVFFEFDSTELSADAAVQLDAFIEALEAWTADQGEDAEPVRIVVDGHADSRGSDRYNQRISEDRAEAVQEYLVDRGIDEGQIDVSAYGSTRPATEETTEDARARNRRVEIRVEP